MNYAALLQMLVGLGAQAEAGKLSKEQLQLQKEQLAKLAGIELPKLEKIIATELPPSRVAALQTDTGLRDKQLQSINSLEDIINSGGMALDDQVAQDAAMSRAAGAARRSRASAAAEMAARGQLNGGAALQMAMAAEQQNANAARQSGMEAAAAAQRRKMEALRELGAQSGSLRGQDFSEKKAAAQAADDRAAWNANAAERAQYHNAGLPQQSFANQMSQVTGQQPAVNSVSTTLGQNADRAYRQGEARAAAAGQVVQGVSDLYGDSTKSQPSTYTWDDTAKNVTPAYADPLDTRELDYSNPWYSQKLHEDGEK